MSLTIQENIALDSRNSLAVPCQASWHFKLTDKDQIPAAVSFAREHAIPLHVLGGGSNVILGDRIEGLVVEMAILGRSVGAVQSEQNGRVSVQLGAGENWHEVVKWSLAQGYFGLENLALIPGTCGAAPIQNIGAYGVELCDVLESVEFYDIEKQTFVSFTNSQCEFEYRDSIFKRELANRVVITSITLGLETRADTNISYPTLNQFMDAQQLENSPKSVFEAVCGIRRSKLPDPQEIPNVGSFFKNPIVENDSAKALLATYPDMPTYEMPDDQAKIPAAWLIDQAGWKGWLRNGVGVHESQALVLINPGKKRGADVLSLAERIAANVEEKYGIQLEIEPRVIT